MALSLDSIHGPLNDFFIARFRTDGRSPVFFRFDKFGSVISDQDFGSVPLAKEKFSDLVNHVAVEGGDGLDIFFSQNQIDAAYYYRLLNPSVPYIPLGTDDVSTGSIRNSFNKIRSDAKRVWDEMVLESTTGLMLQYKPSLANPENWYDSTRNDLWTTHAFKITETIVSPAIDSNPRFRLWKLKIDDATMQKALELNEAKPIDAQVVYQNVLNLRVNPRPAVVQAIASDVVPPVNTNLAEGAVRNRSLNIPVASKGFAVHDHYLQQYPRLDINKRILINEYLGEKAPTQPVKTNSISISFAYCIVNIRRPWYFDAFITDTSWCIPNTAKGELTVNDSHGGNVTVLPIGFVVVKDLSIEANWLEVDIETSRNATDFGPFKIGSEIINNKLSHTGIQIIGWLLQKMPALPPN